MRERDLINCKVADFQEGLSDYQRFIYTHGYINCKKLVAKQSDQILSELKISMPSEILDQTQIDFINQIAGDEVLAYILYYGEHNTDVFVFPENNTPFTLECFV